MSKLCVMRALFNFEIFFEKVGIMVRGSDEIAFRNSRLNLKPLKCFLMCLTTYQYS